MFTWTDEDCVFKMKSLNDLWNPIALLSAWLNQDIFKNNVTFIFTMDCCGMRPGKQMSK